MRIVVLVSGSGTTLQALLDAAPEHDYDVVAVGADRDGIEGLARAERAGVPTFVHRLTAYPDRAGWDAALLAEVAAYEPDLVVLAGFMKLVADDFFTRFPTVNTHPALCPSFPGMHGARDALEYGVKVTGCTLFFVDGGVDTGPIVAQASVEVLDDDTEESLHERIKTEERRILVDSVAVMARSGWRVEGRHVRLGGSPTGR